MNSKHNIILLGLLLTLSGCATTNQATLTPSNITHIISYGSRITLPSIETGKQREWLTRSNQAYPQQNYYSITAQANSPEAAARKVYEAAVGFLNPESEAIALEQIRSQIEVVSLWCNQDTCQALAVIHRRGAEAYLRNQLKRSDKITRDTVTALNITEDPLIKIGLLQTAIKRQQIRAVYQKSLKKIDLTRKGRESPWDTLLWSRQMTALLKELRISPVMDTTLSNPISLTPMLKQGLENAGLHPSRPFEADYILNGKLHIEEKELSNGYIQANGKLQLILQHRGTQMRYGMQDWALEVISLNPEEAKARLLNKAQQLLKQDKRKTIIGIATQRQPGKVK